MKLQVLALKVGERLRDLATRQGRVPFDKGDLRKAHVVEPDGTSGALLSANTPYARAVHDGRPAITIRPKKGKALSWRGAKHPVKSVRQPARKGNPWLAEAVAELEAEGLGFLADDIGREAAADLTEQLRTRGFKPG